MMRLPLGFGNIDFSDWFRGLVAAFVSGGAASVTAGFSVAIKDPEHFPVGSGNFYSVIWQTFIMAGVLGAMAFLRTKPIPDLKIVTTSVAVSQTGSAPPVTVATVSETHQEPAKP
jgi:hypothetical protein